ncbi:hypothetical protein CVT24_001135 [Panaeolus cyanescens]|uniref:Uncharacterized protein n=1 Tax=Panaeolus cyanescens TaxID=181874 RepID=A0A409W6R0_9AGAR|nr:hypothetical protein CVT24_001135 [Panaeolus cyanescens]
MTATTPVSLSQSASAGGSSMNLRSRRSKVDNANGGLTTSSQSISGNMQVITPTTVSTSTIFTASKSAMPSDLPNKDIPDADSSIISPLSPISDTVINSPDSVQDVFHITQPKLPNMPVSKNNKAASTAPPLPTRKRHISEEGYEISGSSPSPPFKKHNSSSDDDTNDHLDKNGKKYDILNSRTSSPTLYSGGSNNGSELDIEDGKSGIARKLFVTDPASFSPIKTGSGHNKSVASVPNISATLRKVDASSSQSIPGVSVAGTPANHKSGRVNTLATHLYTDPRKTPMWCKIVEQPDGETAYIVTLLQFAIKSIPPNSDVIELDTEGQTIRHAMNMDAWELFGLEKEIALKFITFTRNNFNMNPSRDSVLDVMALTYRNDKQSKIFARSAPKTQFFAVDRIDKHPILFWSLGVITSSFITRPSTEHDRPVYRGVHAVLQQWEKERLAAFFSMVFRNVSITACMDGNSAFVFQTRFRSNTPTQSSMDTFTVPTQGGLQVGRFAIPTYRPPIKESSPPPYYNHGYAYHAQVPVYDARGSLFDPMNIDDGLKKLPPYAGEIPEGSCAFISYGAGISLFKEQWSITFYIRHVVILSTPN